MSSENARSSTAADSCSAPASASPQAETVGSIDLSRDFTEMSSQLHITGEGAVLTIFRMGELMSYNEAEKRIYRLAAQDESRHVAFGVMHMRYLAETEPGTQGRDTRVPRLRRAQPRRRQPEPRGQRHPPERVARHTARRRQGQLRRGLQKAARHSQASDEGVRPAHPLRRFSASASITEERTPSSWSTPGTSQR